MANRASDTLWIVAGAIAAGVLAPTVFRRWRPVLLLWIAVPGEVVLFLVTATVVSRARPQLQPLQPDLPPMASAPSGHVAATLCRTAPPRSSPGTAPPAWRHGGSP
ncbi:hypothetical protein OHA72_46805 [Dactylosporangium sp. NBC_01737]|uniref:hypothetical protein n=1 Tax=Dactylosporangium sp. NBC_01737 TaxID=2975959 RepID=UPI002E125CEE|nr:hypothetical protein OHA72_46805 [Dactylosporangium sp. NBC_01737]